MAGAPKKPGIDRFLHKADTRNEDQIVVLRKKHGLTGYAVYNWLREYCISKPGGKGLWDHDALNTQAENMGIKPLELQFIINTMIKLNLIEVAYITGSRSKDKTQFMSVNEDQAYLNKILNSRRENRLLSRFKKVVPKTDREFGREIRTAKTPTGYKNYRAQILNELQSFLILTDQIKNYVHKNYRHLGLADIYWDEFIRHISKTNLKLWHSKLTSLNYPQFFYQYLNNIKDPIPEAVEMMEKLNK